VLDVESFAARLNGAYQRLWLIAAAITGDRTEADDIVQEAALVGLRKLDEFAADTNFVAWMSQIVRLTALNHLRKSNRQNTRPTDPLTLDRRGTNLSTTDSSPGTSVSRDGQLSQLQIDFDDDVLGALEGVGDVARACLLLRIVQQLSYAEIADTLQIPAGTAMSHVHRAREFMRERLKNRYCEDLASSDHKIET
jgi:RNA polymerase sigma-70 factor (ECF subfamily)